MKQSLPLLLLFVTSCIFAQTPLSCLTNAQICEDFENYQDSILGPQSDIWTTWLGVEGGAADGILSEEFASSGTRSLLIKDSLGGQDVVLLLGEQNSGAWDLRWKMYVPVGKDAYFNLQEFEETAIAWNYEVYMGNATDGVGLIGNTTALLNPWHTFTFPHGEWFEVVQQVDYSANTFRLFIANQVVLDTTIAFQLGGVDFFAASTDNRFFVDDVQLTQVPACNPNALICDGFEGYISGPITTNLVAPFWEVTPGFSGEISQAGAAISFLGLNVPPTDEETEAYLSLQLGELTTGVYKIDFDLYGETVFGIFKESDSDDETDINAAIGTVANTLSITSGPEDFSLPLVSEAWHHFSIYYSLSFDTASVSVDGLPVYSFLPSSTVDGLGNLIKLSRIVFIATDNFDYRLDNVEVLQLPTPIVPQSVYFEVDLENLIASGGAVSPNGVHVAGNFQSEAGFPADWQPGTTPLTQIPGTNKYQRTLQIPPGSYQYKFVNGNVFEFNGVQYSEQEIEENCDQVGVNRSLIVGNQDTSVVFCFNYCVICDEVVGTNQTFVKDLRLQPNPATEQTVLHRLNNETSVLPLQLLAADGRLLQHLVLPAGQASLIISLQDLPMGNYWLWVQSGTDVSVLPLSKL